MIVSCTQPKKVETQVTLMTYQDKCFLFDPSQRLVYNVSEKYRVLQKQKDAKARVIRRVFLMYL